MARRYQGRICMVTGGSGGIGITIAERFISEGATVVILDISNVSLSNAKKELAKKGCGVTTMECDVTSAESVKTVVENVIAQYGKIDVLVQCAGITGKTGITTPDVDCSNFELVMDINVKGIFLFCKYVLPHMVRQHYGRIVNIASISGKEGNAGMLAYSTSKAAVIGLTKVIGKEFAESGITVNAIAPAVVKTPMVDKIPAEQVKYMTDKIPMKRCCRREEVAGLVAYIASEEASFTTAFTFDATGGRATY